MRLCHLHITLSRLCRKAVLGHSFYPPAFAELTRSITMQDHDLSNVQDFLAFCDSIDLSSMEGAYFAVGTEVTGTIS